MLGCNHPGFPTVQDIKECYVANPQNPIEFRGKVLAPTGVNELIEFLVNQPAKNCRETEIITWSAFLTYYESLSMIVDKEEHFEYIIRRSWSIPYAPSGDEFHLVTQNFVGGAASARLGSPSKTELAPIPIITRGHTPATPGLLATSGSADDLDDRSLASHSMASQSYDNGSRTSSASPSSRKSRSGARSPSRMIQRRVIVVHSDQSSEVVKIVDDLGKTKIDIESVRKELVSMGIEDIQDIKL